ncbi:MAG: ribosomal-processing cysteine protease Prp [Syntrophomonadaceae bacterium]|jgi:hypothetical protein|nr:ribosomal-processing cysteine protease Prp [Syntrophomonadaceae bacterium]
MIKVTITWQGDFIKQFAVKGHAGFAEAGEDIYCAGVSAITQTALLGLLEHLSDKPDYKLENGFLTVTLPADLSPNDQEKAQIILSTMEKGLLSIEQGYADYLKVDIRRC